MNTKRINQILIFLSLLSVTGSLIYRFYALNLVGILFSLLATITVFIIILQKNNKNNSSKKTESKNITRYNLFLWGLYLIFFSIGFIILFQSRSDIALTSPWEAVPLLFFLFYFFATAVLCLCIFFRASYNLILISLHFFLSFAVALIVYKLGYGFDSFIHEATMKLISETGAVEPKPFYYLAFYSLVIIFHKITFIPISLLSKLLVPALAAATLPIFLKETLVSWYQNKRSIELTVLFTLILPFSFFIVSTPQNLAYLFILIIILVSLKREKTDLLLLWLLALATFFTQPIAGIPAVLFVAAINAYHARWKMKLKKILLVSCFLLLASLLPLAFYLTERSLAPTAVEIENLQIAQKTTAPYLSWLKPQIRGTENFILNFVYLYGFNFSILFLVLVAAGIFISRRYKFLILFYLSSALSLVSAYFFTSALPFKYLIAYERSNYTDRILLIATFFLLPFILIALYNLIEKIQTQNKFIKISLFSFLVILILSSLYLSYPRLDNYYNSHGIATNQNDIIAVQWIENDAKEDYIVLANQQVSAAALHEFGFKKYYQPTNLPTYQPTNLIFYYPIPTGGPLYQHYLKMVYDEPNRETIVKAMKLTGVNAGYFVLNKYWWAFPKLLEEAKTEADSWQEIDNGEVYVFKYTID